MIYRDNDVTIISPYVDDKSFKREYQIVGGSCRLTGVSVTSGQDSKGYNFVGQMKNFSESGRLRFTVGRKGSEAVASWWKGRLSANQCTFNSTPDKLNFAFNVDLVVRLTSGNLGGRVASVRLDDVYIGQGHTGASNNWWFGGRHCTHIGGGKVRVEGLDEASGLKVYMDVRRGAGNSVSEFEFSNYRVANSESWMKQIDSAKMLNEIVLPGSHDAGMGETRNCFPAIITPEFSKTQRHTMRGQLNHGSRYFDVRVDYDKGKLVTYHRSGINSPNGCSGQYVQSLLSDVDGFLRDHPSETVILKFSQIRAYQRDPKVTMRLLDESIGAFTKRFQNAGVSNLAQVKLADVRGKAIMVFDYNDHLSKAGGRYRYVDGTSGGQLAVYDQYSRTSTLSTMTQDQLGKWRSQGGLGQNYLFLLSWTLTPHATSPGVEALARLANSTLPEALDRYSKEYRSKPNIVYIDYVDRSITSSIIALNFT